MFLLEKLDSIIRNVKIFKDLTDEEIKPFFEVMTKRTFPEKNIIFLHETPITHVYIVASGKVKVFRNDMSGKEQIICVKQQGDMFPNVGFFRKENYPANAQAIEATSLYIISLKDFENVLIANPQLSIKLFRLLGDLIVDTQQRLEEMALRSTKERILLLLIRLGETHKSKEKNGWIKINTRFTNSDLANMIGTTRESVNRMISQLRKEEKVKLVDGHFYIYLDKLKEEVY